jgi:hypothetical protein
MKPTFSVAEEQFRRSLLLAVLFILPAIMSAYSMGVVDQDIWWHIEVGRWITENQAVPLHDPFTTIGSEKEWIAYSWLFEIAVYFLYSWFGPMGIVLYTLLATALVTLCILSLLSEFKISFATRILLTAASIFALSSHLSPRPWLISILLFTLLMKIVIGYWNTGRTRLLFYLPPIFLLWANTHIQFIYGLFVLCLALAAVLLSRYRTGLFEETKARPMPLLISSLISFLITFVNPYGLKLYMAVLEIVRQKGPFDYVSEMQSLSFRQFSDWVALGLTLCAAYCLGYRRERYNLFLSALYLVAIFVSFRSTRDIWFVLIVSLTIVATTIDSFSATQPFRLRLAQILISALVSIILLVFLFKANNLNNIALNSLIESHYPASATRFIRERNLIGPVYNHFDWGGYLISELPGRKIAFDGRTNLHGDVRIERSMRTWSGKPGWQQDPDLSSSKLVVAPKDLPLAWLLRSDSRFRPVFEDSRVMVFERVANK